MKHFDHVRQGDKANTYIFSVENGRKKVGKRAVTLVLPAEGRDYLGVSTSEYESIDGIRKRTLLWEEGAKKETPAAETASANVPTPSATQGGMTGGSASNQGNVPEDKGSEKAETEKEAPKEKISREEALRDGVIETLRGAGIEVITDEAEGQAVLDAARQGDLEIKDKIRLFKTSEGEVYGFVKGGKIYLDPKHATADTAIHE